MAGGPLLTQEAKERRRIGSSVNATADNAAGRMVRKTLHIRPIEGWRSG